MYIDVSKFVKFHWKVFFEFALKILSKNVQNIAPSSYPLLIISSLRICCFFPLRRTFSSFLDRKINLPREKKIIKLKSLSCPFFISIWADLLRKLQKPNCNLLKCLLY